MTSERERRTGKVSARKRAEEHKSGFDSSYLTLPDGVQLFNPEREGVYKLDIIPYMVKEGSRNPNADPGQLYFERTYFLHKGCVGPENESHICLKKELGEACPVCELRAAMAKDPDSDEDMIKAMAPKEHQLWALIDHDDEKKGVQLWDMSYHLFGKHLDARVKNSDEEDGYEFYADPEDGKTLKVGLEAKSFGKANYFEAASIDFKNRPPLDASVKKMSINLDACLKITPYEKLKALVLQIDAEEDDEDEEEKKPGKSSTKQEQKEEKKESKHPTADQFGISKGDDVWYKGEKCTVIKISSDGTSLTLVDEDDNMKRAIGPDEVSTKAPEGGQSKKSDAKSAEESKKKDTSTKSETSATNASPSKEEKKKEEDDAGWDDDWQ